MGGPLHSCKIGVQTVPQIFGHNDSVIDGQFFL